MRDAHTEILRRIVSLELAPGVTFTEGALAEQLGHSKTPVREALLLVGADGLVYPLVGSGYRVSHVTLKGARDLIRHWTLLSSHAAGLAAESGLSGHELSMFSDVAEGRSRFGQTREPAETEAAFHLIVGYAARNEELVLDLRRAHMKLERLMVLAERAGATMHDQLEEHGDLLSAIQRGDADSARRLAQEHGAGIEKAIMEALLSSESLQVVNLG